MASFPVGVVTFIIPISLVPCQCHVRHSDDDDTCGLPLRIGRSFNLEGLRDYRDAICVTCCSPCYL